MAICNSFKHMHTWCWAHVRSLQRRWKAFISSKCSFFYWNIDGGFVLFFLSEKFRFNYEWPLFQWPHAKVNKIYIWTCFVGMFHFMLIINSIWEFQWTTWIHLCGMTAIRWRTLKYRVNIRVARCIVAPIDEGCITAHTWSTNQFWTVHCALYVSAREKCTQKNHKWVQCGSVKWPWGYWIPYVVICPLDIFIERANKKNKSLWIFSEERHFKEIV